MRLAKPTTPLTLSFRPPSCPHRCKPGRRKGLWSGVNCKTLCCGRCPTQRWHKRRCNEAADAIRLEPSWLARFLSHCSLGRDSGRRMYRTPLICRRSPTEWSFESIRVSHSSPLISASPATAG
jgi:hypothetical protein